MRIKARVVDADSNEGGLRRILNFGFPGQSLHVAALLFGAELIMVAVRLLSGDELPPVRYLLGPVLGAALWTPLSILLRLPRLPRPGL